MTHGIDDGGTQSGEYEAFKQELMNSPDIMAQLDAMPPDEREAQMTRMFQDYTGQSDILGEQAAAASALRGTPDAEGRQAGNVYVAANPLEHIATAANRIKGGNDYDAAMQGMKDLSADRTAGVVGMANMQRQALRDQQAAAGANKVNEANQQAIQSQMLRNVVST